MSRSIPAAEVSTIILACEAGMGSSLMSVNALKKKLKKAKVSGVTVVHKPARAIPEDAKVVIVHQGLAKVARKRVPDAVIVTFKQFLNDPAFDRIVAAYTGNGDIVDTAG
jgi:mannitol-specific phosphotransferase system IIBC component